MKKLYGTININKKLNNIEEVICEHINYYKLKHEKYGIGIEKTHGNNEIEEINVRNITEDETKINNVLNQFVNNQILPSSEDIIEDMLKQYI